MLHRTGRLIALKTHLVVSSIFTRFSCVKISKISEIDGSEGESMQITFVNNHPFVNNFEKITLKVGAALAPGVEQVV